MSMFRRKNPADLAASLNALKGGSGFSSDDKKEWKLKDTDGVGSAVIRFLPSKNEENPSPFIKLVNHGFKNGGQWYIETCTSTHGDYENCPVCAYMNKNDLYNTNESEYRKLKRNTSYWANILVIKDPAVPSNEGQVFKYRFGKKIMDKINQMVEVDVDMGEEAVDVTCPFDGANFVLKSKLVSGYKNYDDSKFMNQSEIAGINDEAFQKKLWDEMSDLNELLVFKSLEENQKKFSKVMGTAALGGAASKAAAQADKLGADLDDFDKDMEDFTSSKPAKSERTATAPSTPEPSDDGLDDLLAGL